LTPQPNNVLSISGGKDSTAMLLEMLERGESIHSAIFFDTGWEFPQMYEHLDKLEKYTGVKIWRLTSRLPFEYWMFHRPIAAKEGPNKGTIHRVGNGWPSSLRRWCTREKVECLDYFTKPIKNSVQCVGYAFDEKHRTAKGKKNFPQRHPLIEWSITEADALKICYGHGFDWGGLYEYFDRVSCYCCPLQRIGELRTLRKHFPDLWRKMLDMDAANPEHNRGFKDYKTVHDFDLRFADEDRQQSLFKLSA